MKILTHNEREALKQSGREMDIHYSHWHRYLSCMYPEGLYVYESKVKPTLKEYIQWKKDFPGWSDGTLTATHTAWKGEYYGKKLPMNTVLREFYKSKKKNLAKVIMK